MDDLESVVHGRRTRRGVLLGAAAALMFGGQSVAQRRGDGCPDCRRRGLIDVHHHFIPKPYLDQAGPLADAQRRIAWSPERTLDEMDRNGIAVSMLSFPTPLVWFPGREAGRRLARLCNDYCARLQADHPQRFGLFAGLPPPDDTEGCLGELAYALGTLAADGVTLMTSYDGRYLGDPSFAPVMDELNRRKAVVFVHPTDPQCCTAINNGVPPTFGEWPFDTARTIMSLWASDALVRWPDIRFIFSHGGGAIPMIADRIDKFGRSAAGGERRHDALELLKRLYFDTANAANPAALAATRMIADPAHILFGSDFPFVPAARGLADLARAPLTPSERRGVERDNALALMPSLRGRRVL